MFDIQIQFTKNVICQTKRE